MTSARLAKTLRSILEKIDDVDAVELLGSLQEWRLIGRADAEEAELGRILEAIEEGCWRYAPQKCCACGREEETS